MAIPNDQVPMGDGLDPTGAPGASFFVSRTELETLERNGPEWKLEDARFILEAIRSPDAIFEGLLRPGQESGLCYSVRPTHDPECDDEYQNLPRFGFVFLVFARPAVGGYIAFDWEWRQEDGDVPGHPAFWQTDFERRTWLRT
jgi:hypothetical protein